MRTAINVWLTICGPVMMVIGIIFNFAWLAKFDHNMNVLDITSGLIVIVIMATTAVGFFNRIWDIRKS